MITILEKFLKIFDLKNFVLKKGRDPFLFEECSECAELYVQ